MTTGKTVLVPLDGSVESTAVLPIARGLASLLHASLDVFHVGNAILPSDAIAHHLKLSPDDVRGAAIHQETGPVAAAIVRQAVTSHAALIAMCSRRRPSDTRAFGSVAEEVLRSAPCPVVLLGPGRAHEPWALHHLLLPHDGTPTSANAIPPAVDLAARAQAELVVLHVASTQVARPDEPGTLGTPRYVDQPQHEWPAWGEEFLARVRGLGGDSAAANMRLVFAAGDVGAAIVDFARRNAVDLIAVAWRGELDADRAKTMRRIIQKSHSPVVVFRVA